MSRYGHYPNPQLCNTHGVKKHKCKWCTFKKDCYALKNIPSIWKMLKEKCSFKTK